MWPAGWVVRRGQPRMVTVPPVTRAAARNGVALTTSGSTASVPALTGPG